MAESLNDESGIPIFFLIFLLIIVCIMVYWLLCRKYAGNVIHWEIALEICRERAYCLSTSISSFEMSLINVWLVDNTADCISE